MHALLYLIPVAVPDPVTVSSWTETFTAISRESRSKQIVTTPSSSKALNVVELSAMKQTTSSTQGSGEIKVIE